MKPKTKIKAVNQNQYNDKKWLKYLNLGKNNPAKTGEVYLNAQGGSNQATSKVFYYDGDTRSL